MDNNNPESQISSRKPVFAGVTIIKVVEGSTDCLFYIPSSLFSSGAKRLDTHLATQSNDIKTIEDVEIDTFALFVEWLQQSDPHFFSLPTSSAQTLPFLPMIKLMIFAEEWVIFKLFIQVQDHLVKMLGWTDRDDGAVPHERDRDRYRQQNSEKLPVFSVEELAYIYAHTKSNSWIRRIACVVFRVYADYNKVVEEQVMAFPQAFLADLVILASAQNKKRRDESSKKRKRDAGDAQEPDRMKSYQ